MSQKTLEDIHHGLDGLRCAYRELSSLSSAFYRTGNELIGDNLLDIAESMTKDCKLIESAHSEDIHEQFTQAQESTHNMMGAILASTIGLKNEKL